MNSWRRILSEEVRVEFLSPGTITVSGPGVFEWRNALAVDIPGAEYAPSYKKGFWDGKQYLGRWNTRLSRLECGRGMLDRIVEDLHPQEIVVNGFAPPIISPGTSKDHSLRDYQLSALEMIFQKKWGRIGLATNAGKGAIIALAAKNLMESGIRTLIMCDEVSVFDALVGEVRKWSGQQPAQIVAGAKAIPDALVTIGMVPTLARRKDEEWLGWFYSLGALLLDEADKATSASWQSILHRCPNTHYRMGFSGTFETKWTVGEMVVAETIGPVLLKIRNMELVERQISARPNIQLCPFNHTNLKPPAGLRGPQKRKWIYDNGVVFNPRRHQAILELLEPDVPNAIIVNYIEHGRELSRVLPNSMFLHGSDLPEVRRDVLARFKAGEFQNLIVSRILDRGTNDLGHTVGLIFASGEGSLRQTLQRIGRGLRRAGGKEFLYLKDVLDTGHKFFNGASTRRLDLYNEEGFDVEIRGV